MKAVIAVEPSSVPDEQPRRVPPTLVVWGDFLSPGQTQSSWAKQLIASRRFVEERSAATFLDLPSQGVRGNSHLLMSDLNSDHVAELIDYWIRARGF